jgi:hypothetical protein
MMDLARELKARCPAGTAVRAQVRPGRDGFEAHVELLLPQHQVIFNASAATADGAAREALARLGAELRRLELRDGALFAFDARQAA